jgi:hypothetical protein
MWKSAGRASSLRVFTLAFALQVRKKHGKTTVRVIETSVRLIKTSVRVQYTYYKDTHTHTHTLQNNIKPPQYKLKQTQYKIYPNEIHVSSQSDCFCLSDRQVIFVC